MRVVFSIGFFLICLAVRPAWAGDVLVLGDSLSAAYGMSSEQGWVRLLEQRLLRNGCQCQVVNASISGDTTRGGLTRLPAALERHRPAAVIIALGGNDGLRALSLARMEDNLREMIHLSRAAGARVLLLGVRIPANYGPDYAEKFHAVYRRVAETEDVAWVPFFLHGVAETRDLMLPDGIHPAPAAQPLILDNIWPALQPLLVSSR